MLYKFCPNNLIRMILFWSHREIVVILDDKLIGGFPLVGLVIFGVRKHKDFMNYYLMDSSCDDIYGDMEVESGDLFNH